MIRILYLVVLHLLAAIGLYSLGVLIFDYSIETRALRQWLKDHPHAGARHPDI